MFHLSHFNQHHLTIKAECEYTCLGCKHQSAQTKVTLPSTIKKGDIVNIYGGAIHNYDYFESLLDDCYQHKLRVRLYSNHNILNMDPLILKGVETVFIWCPTPIKDDFNFMVGEPLFDEFKESLTGTELSRQISLVMLVRPLSIEALPDFYDLCVDANTNGVILYLPQEFNAEERRYIKRFKRVNNMRVIAQRKGQGNHCFSAPNGINGFWYELNDWGFAMRQSFKRLPLIGRTL